MGRYSPTVLPNFVDWGGAIKTALSAYQGERDKAYNRRREAGADDRAERATRADEKMTDAQVEGMDFDMGVQSAEAAEKGIQVAPRDRGKLYNPEGSTQSPTAFEGAVGRKVGELGVPGQQVAGAGATQPQVVLGSGAGGRLQEGDVVTTAQGGTLVYNQTQGGRDEALNRAAFDEAVASGRIPADTPYVRGRKYEDRATTQYNTDVEKQATLEINRDMQAHEEKLTRFRETAAGQRLAASLESAYEIASMRELRADERARLQRELEITTRGLDANTKRLAGIQVLTGIAGYNDKDGNWVPADLGVLGELYDTIVAGGDIPVGMFSPEYLNPQPPEVEVPEEESRGFAERFLPFIPGNFGGAMAPATRAAENAVFGHSPEGRTGVSRLLFGEGKTPPAEVVQQLEEERGGPVETAESMRQRNLAALSDSLSANRAAAATRNRTAAPTTTTTRSSTTVETGGNEDTQALAERLLATPGGIAMVDKLVAGGMSRPEARNRARAELVAAYERRSAEQ